jgi:hypothetical protein
MFTDPLSLKPLLSGSSRYTSRPLKEAVETRGYGDHAVAGHRFSYILGRTRAARNGTAGLNDVASASLSDTGGSADRVAVSVAAAADRGRIQAAGSDETWTGVATVAGPGWRWSVSHKPAAQLAGAAIGSLITCAWPVDAFRVGSPSATDGGGIAFTIAKAAFIALGANSRPAAHASRSRWQEAAILGRQRAGIPHRQEASVPRYRPTDKRVQRRAPTGRAQAGQGQKKSALHTESVHGDGFGRVWAGIIHALVDTSRSECTRRFG